MPARVEQPFLGQGAGGDDAHHGAPHRPFAAAFSGLGRVLDLLADRHLEPGADQAGEIGFGGVDRDAAHRDVGALVPAALGQRDVERLRRGDRIVKEQLEKIAHPEEQQAARMGAFDLVILRHDRRCRSRRGAGIGAGMFVHRRAGIGNSCEDGGQEQAFDGSMRRRPARNGGSA